MTQTKKPGASTSNENRSSSNDGENITEIASNSRVGERIWDLLGRRAVLLKWPLKSKGLPIPWGHLTVADMKPQYLAELERHNIGVALGAKSDNLVVIDVDSDVLIEPYLESNPILRTTLCTRGKKGCAFWLRMLGDYPRKLRFLKTDPKLVEGGKAGEWRAGVNTQSIISGIHPETKKPYQRLHDAPPVELEFKSIVWPKEILNPPTQDTEETDDTQEVSVCASVPSVGYYSLEDVLRRSTPTSRESNHWCALYLARGVKTLEKQAGKNFTPEERRNIHNQWLARNKFLTPGVSLDDYFDEFIDSYGKAKFLLGEGDAVPRAVEAAKKNPIPPEAWPTIMNPDQRLLIAVCRELQGSNDQFFLSCRIVQGIFGHRAHDRAARWLRCFRVHEVLEELEKGVHGKASRYRYNPWLHLKSLEAA